MKKSELVNFYNSIEQIKSCNIWEIQKILYVFNSLENNEEWKIIVERKMLLLEYDIYTGKITIPYKNIDVKGNKIENSFFESSEIEYLEYRIKKTNNLFLKAKYNHILWQEKKHLNYAKFAIDLYLKILDEYTDLEYTSQNKIISSLLHISNTTKNKKDYVKNKIEEIIKKSEINNKGHLLKLLLEQNFLEKSDIEKYIDEIKNWFQEHNYFANLEHFNLGIVLCNKIQNNPSIFYELLAKNEDIILEKHPNKEDFLHISSLGKKCQFLQKTSNKLEYDKWILAYTNAKQFVKLKKIKIPFDPDLTDLFNEYIKQKSDIILKYNSDEIFGYFSLDEDLIVNAQNNIQNTKKSFKNSFHNLHSVIAFDINTNFNQLNEKEKLQQQIIQNYSLENSFRFHILFQTVLMKGIIQGKINYQKVLVFFSTYTWYGNYFTRQLKEENEEINWITLIAPGLFNFFKQFELSTLMTENYVNNFILTTDSLTLKFEGALRDFIKLAGGSTSISKNDGMQEQLLEELLSNEKVIELFSENDIELFKYTFTKKGINLRNNIAHSFMSYSNYSLQNISLVILCFFRLGKYNFK